MHKVYETCSRYYRTTVHKYKKMVLWSMLLSQNDIEIIYYVSKQTKSI